ncbi:MAG TPA: hypothetical protein VIY73_16015 [Polyangiaceae bacterium]
MPSDGPKVWAGYRELDALLAREPVGHATSPAWMAYLERWLLGGRVRAVLRKGRQGGGSEVFGHRLPVAIAIFGDHVIPPGTRARILFVSQRQAEANDKLRGVEHVLNVLRVRHARSGDEVALLDRPIVFQSYPCSESAVRGPTCLYALEDELAVWRNADGVNPAHRIDAAILPSGATQPNFRIAAVSSPIGFEDFHAELFARGETANQCVAEGPSWHWNPVITEQRTHELQPDEVAWRREFAAIPQGALQAAFDPDAVNAACEPRTLESIDGTPVVALDPAGRGSDDFAICAVGWCFQQQDPDAGYVKEPVLYADGTPSSAFIVHRDRPRAPVEPLPTLLTAWDFRSIPAAFRHGMTVESIVGGIVALGRDVGASRAVTDQSEAFSLGSLLQSRGLPVEVYNNGGANGARCVSRLRGLLNARRVYIDGGERVRRQLLAFEEKVGANGISYQQSRDPHGGHYDDLSAILLGVRADLEGTLRFGPAPISNGLFRAVAGGWQRI